MHQMDMSTGTIVANAAASERADFIRRTYLHVAGAILVFTGLEAMLLQSGVSAAFMQTLSGSKWMWLVVLGLFMLVSVVANNWAHSNMSRGLQYAGLGLFAVAEAVIFMPLIYIAMNYAPDVLSHAVIVTLALVAGITFTAFTTRKNFSFLAPILSVGGIIALGIIIASIVFGFSLGLVFSGAMIVFAAASILYSTSNIIHEYHTDQHVAAALSLFSSVGLLFWYVLQFFMSLTGED